MTNVVPPPLKTMAESLLDTVYIYSPGASTQEKVINLAFTGSPLKSSIADTHLNLNVMFIASLREKANHSARVAVETVFQNKAVEWNIYMYLFTLHPSSLESTVAQLL